MVTKSYFKFLTCYDLFLIIYKLYISEFLAIVVSDQAKTNLERLYHESLLVANFHANKNFPA